ncbi:MULTISPECIES: DUF928 domain-containing protein [unclassified Coleofasciculus]|uniref:DUF928 domain-containing protein n=1 Tax=Cyanophyceae TaxID=3028117 RepID=UPI001686C7FE|nr:MULTISPECIES: DUF928 domain-containing protein [unclassified Coleofasciculus]MBD1880824.1 DUF928 domain-containing protein [Coleofasciculus sp. FACHB-T130]
MVNKSSVYFTTLSLALFVGLSAIATSFPATATTKSKPIQQPSLNRREMRVAGRLRFRLPRVGAPKTREPGASRGSSSCAAQGKSLMALLPSTNVGLTVAARPTLFVAVPKTSAQDAEFILYDGETSQQVIYETTLPIPSTGGVVSVSLPQKDAPSLVAGKKYRWSLSMICDAEDRGADISVEGWIQRVQPNVALRNDLKKAAPRDRPAIYAEAGMWLDTLSSLADLRNANPSDFTLETDWKDLLKLVNLGTVAEEPLVVDITQKQTR